MSIFKFLLPNFIEKKLIEKRQQKKSQSAVFIKNCLVKFEIK